MNVEERLTTELDAVQDQFERSTKGVTDGLWFRLAIVAVHALVLIASALWDKER